MIVSPAILVFLWMLSLSLKNEIDNLAYPPVFIPSPPTLANFVQVFDARTRSGCYFWNSIVVSGGATLIALAGRRSRRLRHRPRAGAHRLTVLILIARMTPALSYLIPLFTVFQFLGLNNTLTALVITHLVITVPIVVYIMAGLLRDAAAGARGGGADRRRQRVDERSATSRCRWRGRASSSARSSRSSSPGTISCSARCWPAAQTRTLPVAVYNVLTFEQLAWGPLAAAALVVTLPVLLLTIVIQKEIVAGLTHGGVKA